MRCRPEAPVRAARCSSQDDRCGMREESGRTRYSFARQDSGLLVEPETNAEVQHPCRCFSGSEAELDASCTRFGKEPDSCREYVAREPPSLVIILGTHRFDKADGGVRIEPEQSIRREGSAVVQHKKIKLGAIHRGLPKARFKFGAVSGDHVMRALQRVAAAAQPVPFLKRADRWSSVHIQPCSNDIELFVLLVSEAMADQHFTHDVIGAIDHDVDGSQSELAEVRKPTLHDMCDPLRSCVWHHDWVESDLVAPVCGEHCCFWTTDVVEPEKLRKTVG
jgi:hypothetical protein